MACFMFVSLGNPFFSYDRMIRKVDELGPHLHFLWLLINCPTPYRILLQFSPFLGHSLTCLTPVCLKLLIRALVLIISYMP